MLVGKIIKKSGWPYRLVEISEDKLSLASFTDHNVATACRIAFQHGNSRKNTGKFALLFVDMPVMKIPFRFSFTYNCL